MAQLFTFDPSTARPVNRFDSRGASIVGLAHVTGEAFVQCIYLQPGGVIGGHPAVTRQLFAVVCGAGWVRKENGERVALSAGQAALWEAGEWHESGSDAGMTVIIVEGEFDPPEG